MVETSKDLFKKAFEKRRSEIKSKLLEGQSVPLYERIEVDEMLMGLSEYLESGEVIGEIASPEAMPLKKEKNSLLDISVDDADMIDII